MECYEILSWGSDWLKTELKSEARSWIIRSGNGGQWERSGAEKSILKKETGLNKVSEVRGSKSIWRTSRLCQNWSLNAKGLARDGEVGLEKEAEGRWGRALWAMQTSFHFTLRAMEDVWGILISRVMLSVIKNKVIVTGLDRSKVEAGRPVRRKVRDAVCTREGGDGTQEKWKDSRAN